MDFRPQQVEFQHLSGYQVKRVYCFLTIDEFKARFGLTPKQVRLPVDTLLDEQGQHMVGVLMAWRHDWQSYRQVE
eukprot:4689043-Lingulodinium_polyedra.AAC.1